jgi:HlyD family secretion protein
VRPDLNVEGTIELERLPSVLFVGRPSIGQAGGPVQLFKVEPDGTRAARAMVTLGRASVKNVEVVTGLQEGDRVILSDMSPWERYDRVELH